jgi:crotonobetainyl-CoA:carnitine CoA-transferase CaiB-like acyl-CoA transferase
VKGDTARPPLEGIRVLDFSRLFAGPYATMTLADLGADVVKVEPPGGDEARGFGPPFLGGEGMNYMAMNRNKRSITVDLKNDQGLAVTRRLAAHADVVVENFRPGVAEKLGIGYADLVRANPGLIYCSISGFGRTGEYADRPALDLILQAFTGVMDRQGGSGEPKLLVVAIADTYAAAMAVQSVLAALLARSRDGKGQRVDVTLMEALIAAQGYRIISPAAQIMLPAIDDTCPYQAFRGSDSRWFVLAVVSPNNWKALCAATGLAALGERADLAANPGRVAARSEVIGELERVFATRPAEDWLRLLRDAGVPCSSVRRVEDVLDDPHVLGAGTVIEVDHPTAGRLRTMGSPLHLAATPVRTGGPAPRQGEHTREILREHGYSGDDITRLLSLGAVSNICDTKEPP